MSDNPIQIHRYIQLSVKEPLDKSQIRTWLSSVKATAPSGILASIQTTDDKGALKSVSMVHRETSKRHMYLIPLTRDIGQNEVQKIVDDFAKKEPNLDFDIESNEIQIERDENNSISLNDEKHLAICKAMAKARHEKWMKERLRDGWRYGINFDKDEKTHPLLRPWEQLPDEFKEPDLDAPQAIFDLINNQGYTIIANDDLDRLKYKAKIESI